MSHNRCPCCSSTLLSQHHTPQSQASPCPHFPLKQKAALKWVQLGSGQISTRYLHVAKVDCGCVYKQPPVSHITVPSPTSRCSVWKVWTGCEDLLGSVVSRKWRLCLCQFVGRLSFVLEHVHTSGVWHSSSGVAVALL